MDVAMLQSKLLKHKILNLSLKPCRFLFPFSSPFSSTPWPSPHRSEPFVRLNLHGRCGAVEAWAGKREATLDVHGPATATFNPVDIPLKYWLVCRDPDIGLL